MVTPDFDKEYTSLPRMGTYALGVHALREKCIKDENTAQPRLQLLNGSSIYRAMTFKETVEAKVDDYERYDKSQAERKRLWGDWLDTCSAFAYEENSTKFQFARECIPLIKIPKHFKGFFFEIPYSSVDGIPLDSSEGIYNEPLPYAKIEDHAGWRAVLEDDVALLRQFRDITWHESGKPDALMVFFAPPRVKTDTVLAACVNDLSNRSNAGGNINLSISGRFLLAAHTPEAFAKRKRSSQGLHVAPESAEGRLSKISDASGGLELAVEEEIPPAVRKRFFFF
ncbi:hypothetical protein COV20_04110 [Candidatus Woesearchaeota archaeon CG10_big_fil_rev_8_21_14_0_10_45_16]|nr:MAG: hypothetical protein COV20_04110 [Candidatus Woesearchaeota archaeon CG10_big_fil_rev_8_21_14_0_10_45_16]